MSKLSQLILLASILALLGVKSVTATNLPSCNQLKFAWHPKGWHNCVGYTLGGWPKYLGVFVNDMKNGSGVLYSETGKILQEGIWRNDTFIESKKNEHGDTIRSGFKKVPVQSNKSPRPSDVSRLREGFIGLGDQRRKQVQQELKKSGYYGSVIDGLYGKGTAAALKAYNKEYLGNADLSKKANVDALFADILKSQPTQNMQVVAAQVEPIMSTPEPGSSTTTAVIPKQPSVSVAEMQLAYDSQDYLKAREAAEALAIQGEADAQFLLGKMYAEGLGTLQISKTAHMWFNIASLNGSAEAVNERNRVAETMTANAVEEAQELALKCIQSKYADCGLSIQPKQKPEVQQPVAAAILDGAALGNAFKAQSVLRRKQLQYALKKLGVYSSSVDGLWGNGTRTAFSNYIKINNLKASSGEDVFASVLSKVDVPSAFAAPKRATGNQRQSVNSNSNAGLRAIISRPSVTGAQALAICEPQAEMAGENASRSYRSPSYGSTANCSGYGSAINCSIYDNSGGFWGGVADGLGKGFARRDARNAALKSCLAKYGWKK